MKHSTISHEICRTRLHEIYFAAPYEIYFASPVKYKVHSAALHEICRTRLHKIYFASPVKYKAHSATLYEIYPAALYEIYSEKHVLLTSSRTVKKHGKRFLFYFSRSKQNYIRSGYIFQHFSVLLIFLAHFLCGLFFFTRTTITSKYKKLKSATRKCLTFACL